MKLNIEIDEHELRKLVLAHVQEKLGEVKLSADDIKIEVKSTQNFRSEWEPAAFRARVEKTGA